MMNKKIIIPICAAMLFVSMPVQAYEDFCPHPTSYEKVDRGFVTNSKQHREWSQEYEQCCVCGERHHLEEIEYGDWEDHDWEIES